MIKFQAILISLFYFLCPSTEVVISPCNIENIVTQPHFGTSLAKKEIVQIVQIPPVFTQNVIVGKCINATESSLSTPGSYFVCKQRYSAIEVYIMENQETEKANYSSGSIIGVQLSNSVLDNFRTGVFIRDYVAVESGCDFTFNLLPLLLRQDEIKTPKEPTVVEENHNYHFLNSPYHPTYPGTLPKKVSLEGLLSDTNTKTTKTQAQTKTTNYSTDKYGPTFSIPATPPSPAQNQISPTPKPKTKPKIYSQQGGNGYINGFINGNTNTANQGSASTLNANIYHITPTESPYGGTVDVDVFSQSYKSGQDSNNGESYTTTTYQNQNKKQSFPANANTPAYGYDQELYGLSDKVGVPLYILSSKVDPLLSNIDRSTYYTSSG